MSEANEDTGVDDVASRCSHGGGQPMAIADRYHEPARMNRHVGEGIGCFLICAGVALVIFTLGYVGCIGS